MTGGLSKSKLPKVGLPRGMSGRHEIHARHRDAHADPDGDRLPAPGPDDFIPMDAGREPLSQDELLTLQDCEITIQKGLKTFYEVGEALLTIRENRLYRQSYDTFAEYCEARWDMKRAHAYRLISASEVIANLSPMGDILPESERQARPLTQLEPDAQREAWQKAVETAPDGKVTAAHVQAVVDERKPPQMTPPEPHPEPTFQKYAGQPPVVPPTREPVRYVGNGDDYVEEAGDTFMPDVPVVEEPVQDNDKGQAEIEVVQIESDDAAIHVGATVRMVGGQTGTVASVNGRLVVVDTPNGQRVYDRMNISVVDEPAPNYKIDNKRTFPQDETVSQPFDRCQTPAYALDPLLPYLPKTAVIWEPAAGEFNLVHALYDAGFTEKQVIASDILTDQNFFEYEPSAFDVLVTNPPYSLKLKWAERCYQLGKPFALLIPLEVLGTKTLFDLMQQYGFEMMLLDSRVDFKMPNKGWDGSSPFPVVWFCWHVLPQQVMYGSIAAQKKAFNEHL